MKELNSTGMKELDSTGMKELNSTGKMKLVDTAGRVDKFMNRYQKHFDKRK